MLFARSAGNKYGTPKWKAAKKVSTSTESSPGQATLTDTVGTGRDSIDSPEAVEEGTLPSGRGSKPADVQTKEAEITASFIALAAPGAAQSALGAAVSSGTETTCKSAYVPSKSARTTACIPALAGLTATQCTLPTASLTGPSSAKTENLEHAVYFNSWGIPAERETPGMYMFFICS